MEKPPEESSDLNYVSLGYLYSIPLDDERHIVFIPQPNYKRFVAQLEHGGEFRILALPVIAGLLNEALGRGYEVQACRPDGSDPIVYRRKNEPKS